MQRRLRPVMWLLCLTTMHLQAQVMDHVVISEVFYLGATGSNSEFVELYNPTGSDISLNGLSLQTELVAGTNAGSWHVDLTGKTIKAFGFLLVGQDSVVPAPDLPIPTGKGLNNSANRAVVRIFSTATNQVIDLVAWDAANTLGLEGTPFTAAGTTSSNPKSIERKARSSSTTASMLMADSALGNGYDSNDNGVDFLLRDVPQPQNAASPIETPSAGPDTEAPAVLSLKVLTNTSLRLQFTESLDSASSSLTANYALSGGATVMNASRDVANRSRVLLTTSPMAPGVYTLTVSSVADTSGNAMSAPQNLTFASGVIPIAQARTLGTGSIVRVRGTVTVGGEFGSPAYLQDTSAGLAVFNNTFSQRAKPGDVWEVEGALKDFNGLLEIDPLTDSLRVTSAGPPVVPLRIRAEDLGEIHESKLVRIDRVKFFQAGAFGAGVDSTYQAGDPSGAFQLRIDKDSNIPGTPIPADSVNVVGVVNEFNGSYRLMPRSFGDVGVSDPAPNQTWIDMSVARGYAVGSIVRVRGLVTYVQPGTTNTVYLQDATGGIALYDPMTNGLLVGDSVEVRGTMDVFNNLQEIKNIDSVWSFGSGHPLPSARTLTLPQAAEPFEGMLVRFEKVRFVQSGSFAGNTTYQISDGVNQLDVRIPAGSALVGLTIPAGALHATGVLGQYQARYQLIPRTSADLVALPGPQISATPVVDSLFDTGFRVRWSTVTDGSTKLLYGSSDAMSDSVSMLGETTDHVAMVTGLMPGRIYTYYAISANASGTSDAGPAYVVTTSSTSSGQMLLYFNHSVEASLPFAESAEGGVDLGAKLLERISAATHSIDVALYSFDDFSALANDIAGRVADSLVAAKSRGVSVRVVFHDRATTVPLSTLINAGIPVLKRTVVSTGSGMHNKFWVFDGRGTEDATDDWVVTGSWNVTDAGTYRDAQNALFIQDRSLASIYTKEFDEMFGSSTDVPNASAARFGPTKRDDTPHWTIVGGRKVEVFFSPSDRTSAAIIRALHSADHNAMFGLFSFTRDDIAMELIARRNAGVIVRGIIDNTTDSGSEFVPLQSAGVDVLKAGHGVVLGDFHHKYGVVDPFHDASDPIAITGSHNWSSSAETDNDENTLIIHSGPLARQYVREFARRYAESGGSGPITHVDNASSVPAEAALLAPYPNPFNPSTMVRFMLPEAAEVRLRVFDLLGRSVADLMVGPRPPGTFMTTWEAGGMPSGTYLIVLEAGGRRLARKVTLIR